MDAEIIRRCNEVVGPDDTLYVLGDIGFLPVEEQIARLNQMNGRKFLLWGNHDVRGQRERKDLVQCCFQRADDLWKIKARVLPVGGGMVKPVKIVLCHYAMRVWDGSFRGSWHLYGHSHGTLPDDPNSLSLDVGVDCWDFYPVSLDQVAERMSHKTWTHPENRKE